MFTILLCVTLVSAAHSANVLVIAGIFGSHLYFSIDMAEKLVEFGHNVTVLTLYRDSKVNGVDKSYRLITLMNEDESELFSKRREAFVQEWMHHPSKDMTMRLFVNIAHVMNPKSSSLFERTKEILEKHFTGEEFFNLLETGHFDLIALNY